MRASQYLLKESKIQIPSYLSPLLKEHASSIIEKDKHIFDGVADAMEEAKKTGNYMPLMAAKHRFGEYLKDKHGLKYKHTDFLLNKFNPEDFRNGNVAHNITENKYLQNNKFNLDINKRYQVNNNSNIKGGVGKTLKLTGSAATLGAAVYASQ